MSTLAILGGNEFLDLYDKALRARGDVNKIYLHWSAGRYRSSFDDYHINILGEPAEVVLTTDDLTEYKPHTWQRNSGAVGIALACCYGAVTSNGYDTDFGEYPPTPEQIDLMSKVVTILCTGLDLPIDKEHVMTHCEAAIEDGYGPYSDDPEMRWDLWYLPDSPGDGILKPGGDVIRGKAIWYYNQLLQAEGGD